MSNLVKIRARPKLNAPNMLATWPGIASVATIVATYLRRKLDFKELGEVEAQYFFDPIGATARDNVIEEAQFPQSQFFYWKNTRGRSDLILFIGEDQPPVKAYALANCVLDVAVSQKVKRVYTCAAAATRIHHSEQPKVWGVATNQQLMDDLKKYDLRQRGNMQIAGLNGLLLSVAKERAVDGICLLGEVPAYATRIPNPMAALAIIEVLVKMLDIKVDTAELAEVAEEAKERLKQMAAEAMGEYIDLFTEPIWEQGEEEEEDE